MNRASFSIQIASHAIADQADGWNLLLPAGEVACRDGRGPYSNDDPQRILDAFSAWGMPLDVDYHHQSLSADEKVGLVPSAGSVVELENRNGEIWGRFEWTEAAIAAIADKEVKFLSPVFDFDGKTMRILNLVSIGLTNLPNLYLNPLSANSLGGKMDEFIEWFCYRFNLPLPPLTTVDQVKAYLQNIIDYLGSDPAAATEAMSQLSAELKLEKTAKWSDIARAACARLAPGATVPREEYERVANALAAERQERHALRVGEAVAQAMRDGKVAPNMEAWAQEYASKDWDGFKAYVANAHSIVPQPPSRSAPSSGAAPEAIKPVGGFTVNQDKAAIHAQAKAHQAKHGGNFIDAVKAIQPA